MQEDTTNPLLCKAEEGFCEKPGNTGEQTLEYIQGSKGDNLQIIYFTDPICSACWGIEPQLRRLKLEYGSNIKIDYRMGGLLPDWSYNSGGISKPSDVAHHWEEVSLYYDMPIDGSVWLEDPLDSSYPPSIAFKAVQIQDPQKAIIFLREIRELVFLHKKNITRTEYLEEAALKTGVDPDQYRQDYEVRAKELFSEDLKLSRQWGVRGFPTLFFQNTAGKMVTVYGTQPYTAYETAIQKLNPSIQKNKYDNSWKALFSIYPSMTAREFSELTGLNRSEAEITLNKLTSQGLLQKTCIRNGAIWKL